VRRPATAFRLLVLTVGFVAGRCHRHDRRQLNAVVVAAVRALGRAAMFQYRFTGYMFKMVNKLEDAARWRAPGRLEYVRRFLNTWEHLARTREDRDHLPSLALDEEAWKRRFPSPRRPREDELEELTALRMGLRRAVEDDLDVEWLNAQLEAARLTVTIDASGSAVRYVPAGEAAAVSDLLAIVVEAIGDGTWQRLKACPDCQLVFFDRTRNASKRWCQMSARQGGRACGSIAKVQSWRARKGGAGT
jgi:predicted RNA-binding Zn ribbon-like protein